MNDLISRKALLTELEKLDITKMYFPANFKELVEKQPTAYDPNKVVEQLNFEKGVAFMTLGNTGDEDYDFAYDNVMSYMNKAIAIVKKGGSDE